MLVRRFLRTVAATALLVTGLIGSQLVTAAAADANVEWVWACGAYTPGGSGVFSHSAVFGINTPGTCPGNEAEAEGLTIITGVDNTVADGKTATWQADAPAGLTIIHAWVPFGDMFSQGVNDKRQYGGGFYWAGAGSPAYDGEQTYSSPTFSSSYFGWSIACGTSPSCHYDGTDLMSVTEIELEVQENTGPSITASGTNNLWNQTSHYVWGSFPVSFVPSDVSGVCSAEAKVDGTALPVQLTANQNQTVWDQCDPSGGPQELNQSINTNAYPNGTLTLEFAASNAAGVSSDPIETLRVDNVVPSVVLSGPANASSADGTQYITANATAGLSLVQRISCSLDNAPAQSYAGSSAEIPVSGIGNHSVTCSSENNSYNSSGQARWSMPVTKSLDIGQPTLSGISFSKIVDGPSCKRVRERVKVPARWVTVHRHGDLVKVHRRAHKKTVKAVKCRLRTAKRNVTVLVKEKKHGRTVLVKRRKVERVVVPPHVVSHASERVADGEGTTVSGWLGTSNYIALGGRTVHVMTAPNNGHGDWTQAAVATTATNGGWSAHLPAGPSRLVDATYGGDATTEPSNSSTIHLIVPAKVKVRIRPRRVPWGGTIRISGRVLGGYIPTGKLLRLRIGVAGVRETVGIPNIRRDGRFQTTWTFASGSGVVRYWFSISTLNEADYPFAPASSRPVYVTVGPG
jgi:hypothetical protein